MNSPSLHTYGIVGDGRLARHLIHYFRLKNLTVHTWNRKMNRTAETALKACDVVLVLISDDKIASWIKKNPWLKSKIALHCSGTVSVKNVQSFHPLFNFTDKVYDLSVYESIPFVVEKGEYTFKKMFPDFRNPSFTIEKKNRALYHSLCVMSGNFPTMLWQACSEIFSKKLNMPFDVLIPYLSNCVEEFRRDPRNSLTGPFARGDQKTIESNVKALKKSALKPIYKSFAKQFPKLKKEKLVHLPKAKPSPRVSETARSKEPSRETASTLQP